MNRIRLLGVGLVVVLGCAESGFFDSVSFLRGQYMAHVGAQRAAAIEVPFELDRDVRAYLGKHLKPSGSEERRAGDIVDFVFDSMHLQYALSPTRNAVDTFRARQGNCLSFVNLFIGIARENRLNAFYVEVEDAQRWTFSHGLVVSQGHIVAGLNVGGKLRTYDFLPYRPKSYRNFKPIDDLTGAAHFFNNLGAEALLAGDLDGAARQLETAVEIAPRFERGWNNLGVLRARRGDVDGALAAYRSGLEVAPEDPSILTNMVRAFQRLGRDQEASDLLGQLKNLRIANPFYYIYEGDLALSRGDLQAALTSMTEALRRESELPEVHVGLAKVYLALGDLERARHFIERALKLDPTHPEARRLAGMLAPATAPAAP